MAAAVSGSAELSEGQKPCFDRGLELGEGAYYQGRANPAGEVCEATLERVGEDEELGLSC
jgi:hypothetical protein